MWVGWWIGEIKHCDRQFDSWIGGKTCGEGF